MSLKHVIFHQHPKIKVLQILPYTLFKVVKVTEPTEAEPFSIYLQNLPVPEQSLISFLTEKPKYIV